MITRVKHEITAARLGNVAALLQVRSRILAYGRAITVSVFDDLRFRESWLRR